MARNMKNSIFFRESNGLSYERPYDASQILLDLLQKIGKKQMSGKIACINNGKVLETNLNLAQNDVKPNSIIHISIKQKYEGESGVVFVSFKGKIYKTNFSPRQEVIEFKRRLQPMIGVKPQTQIILFKSLLLANDKQMKQYEIRNHDFLCMGQSIQFIPQILSESTSNVIFPTRANFNIRKRSQIIQKKNDQLSNSDCRTIDRWNSQKSISNLFSSLQNKNRLSYYVNNGKIQQQEMNGFSSGGRFQPKTDYFGIFFMTDEIESSQEQIDQQNQDLQKSTCSNRQNQKERNKLLGGQIILSESININNSNDYSKEEKLPLQEAQLENSKIKSSYPKCWVKQSLTKNTQMTDSIQFTSQCEKQMNNQNQHFYLKRTK